ncbi:RpiR family transcriptional regulator [Paenibacillus sp. J31TS4]|uniref:MurR/RpiR family transcriptional regulator n=1 Tax=Paenibacillus sp. J31TS4 TaxID=2807195 RepID=UPI001B0E0C88|nr:MurR/RpiR family transcriptional regulator [Paenibacillus sp. J31TS4]GIP41453.1 RpiR family transcriptional regulator [Paenibacillus sp. J31TS4]
MNDLSALITSYYPSLTKSEQKVASLVLDKPDEAMFHSITELAEISGVGETTVIRFCRKVGYHGFQDFKLALAQDLTFKKLGAVQQEDSEDYTRQVFQDAVSVLQTSINLLDRVALEQAVELLDGARHIQLFGVGASGITAMDAKNRLLRIGRRSDAILDSHLQAMMAVTLGEGDVALGFSVSGSTKDTNDMLGKAKRAGARVIAVTNYAKSPITSLADVVLLTAGKESPLEGGSMTTKMSQLFVVDLLCRGLALRNAEYAKAMKEKTAQAVSDRIY